MPLLLHAFLMASSLAALHVGLSWKAPLSPVRFCAAAAAAHVVVGLAVWLPTLARQAGRSWTTAWWTPLLVVGLFATGAVLAAAWLGAVRVAEAIPPRFRSAAP
jgi:hypothetical protein